MYEATACILQAVAFFAKKKPIRMVGAVEGIHRRRFMRIVASAFDVVLQGHSGSGTK